MPEATMPETLMPDEARDNGLPKPEEPTETSPRVIAEPLTYQPGAPTSYFRDLALNHHGNSESGARLARHAAEMRVELPKREERAERLAALQGVERGLELRVNPTRTPGQGGYFAPPLWLLDKFATAPRVSRVLASLIPSFPLPGGVQSVSLPRLSTGTATAAVPDGATPPSQDEIDAAATSPVVTISGQGDTSLQLLEQSPAGAHLDWVIFKDLRADYDARLETLLVNGSGQGGQFYGLLNVPGRNAVAYPDATPSGPRMYPMLGQVAAAIGDTRMMPPEVWLMRTARWAWLGTAEDSTGQPLAVPAHNPPGEIPYLFDDRRPTPASALLGWPIYCDDALPGGAATGSLQDAIVACRPTDMVMLESDPRTLVGLEVLSGVLMARLQLRAYVAAVVGRYPTSIGTLTGVGMIIAPNF